MPCAFADPPPASALPSLTAPSLRNPPLHLHAASTCAVSFWVTSGTSTAPPLNLSRASLAAHVASDEKPGGFFARDARLGGDRDDRREIRNAGTMACREPFASRSGVALPPEHARSCSERRRGVPALFRPSVVGRRWASRRRMEDGVSRRSPAALVVRSRFPFAQKRGHSPPPPRFFSHPAVLA